MTRVRPLSKATTPIEGESARGLVCRALGDGGVPLSFNVLRRVGMQHRNVVTISESDELDVDALAKVIRVDPADLEARRYPSLGRDRLSFFGLEVPSRSIEKKVRRFSPAALAESAHIRAAWELKDLPFCPAGWDMLVDTCVCGIRQGWIRLNGVHRCDDCGRLLKDTPTSVVPVELRPALSLFGDITSPRLPDRERALASLPERLRVLGASDVFRGIARLRRSASNGMGDGSEDLAALHDACVLALTWRSDAAAWLEASKHAVRRRSPTPADLSTADARRDVQASSGRGQPAPRLATRFARERIDAPRLLGIRPAYELAKLTPETLLAGRARGHLSPLEHVRGGRLVPAFDPDEVARFADAVRARLSCEAVANRLGLGRRAVLEIAAAGHMTASGLALREGESSFSEQDVTDFEDRIRVSARGALVDPIGLEAAFRLIHGRTKPWAAFVATLLAGDLPSAVKHDGERLFDGLVVDRSSVRLLVDLQSSDFDAATDRVTQGEALAIINAPRSSRALRVLASEGVNPVTYALVDVLDLARRGISTLEIAARVGQSPGRTHRLMARLGVASVAEGLWDRAEVDRAGHCDRNVILQASIPSKL